MSEVYTIQGETLTALANAVRSKVGETKIVYKDEYVQEFAFEHPSGKGNGGSYAVYGVGDNWVWNETGFTTMKITTNIDTDGALNIRPFYEENKEFDTVAASGEAEHTVSGFSGYVKLLFQSAYYTSYIEGSITISLYDADGNILTCFPVEVVNTLTPGQMADAVSSLIEPPSGSDFLVTGKCRNRFAYNGWNWFLDKYKDFMATSDITDAFGMFHSCDEMEEIPLELNIYGDMIEMFYGCTNLKSIGDFVDCKFTQTREMFYNCSNLRYLPNFVNPTFAPSSNYCRGMFSGCYSLREVPEEWLKGFTTTSTTTYLAHPVNNGFNMCNVLDEVRGVPVGTGTCTANLFRSTFYNCNRLKNVIFTTQEDGTPYTAKWSNQTIDLSTNIGYASNESWMTGYNTGITSDKKVSDDTTYQALKDDPDWYTLDVAYSRYNHDSAVATINSLPDTSATSNSTNVIKFKGEAGSATDGGAINTLTEEEIAVATAKGWTVTLV